MVRRFSMLCFSVLVLVLICLPGLSESRGPRFGNKPHPGRVEHIYPGTHGEIVYHQDPRIFQGSDALKQGSVQIDAGGYWETWKFGKTGLKEGAVVNQKLDDSSGYYEGISKPKYEYRRYQGFRNVNAATPRICTVSSGIFGSMIAALTLILTLLITSASSRMSSIFCLVQHAPAVERKSLNSEEQMEVLCPTNDVKIYNLSAGKSLPEWISARKRRRLVQKDVDIRQRIELIQDFDMPDVSNVVEVSRDNQYIFAAGIYKPRIKCFDVSNMSLKFERCLDAEVIKLLLLSEDYKKLIILEQDRYVEFHTQQGFYHKIRIPRFGRDMVYNDTNCDLYLSGTGSEIYRYNLEAGQFQAPFSSSLCPSLTKLDLNVRHYLLSSGSMNGVVEARDPRSRQVVGSVVAADVPITSLKSRNDGLITAVGTSDGRVILYDIRSPTPLLMKDHFNKLPIKSIAFHSNPDLVFSVDSKVLKMWDRKSGEPYTAIESKSELNGLCAVPETGLLFMPNESKKMLTYYIPSLGPAPRWCSFLDNLTEELEETTGNVLYDDYKFVTKNELEELGLGHLIGSDLLRAYMHGYFIDRRLHERAKIVANPFAFEDYRKRRIKEKLGEATESRVKIEDSLPKVNRSLAKKLNEANDPRLIEDERFGVMFKNPDFQIDEQSDDYRLLNPLVANLEKRSRMKKENVAKAKEFRLADEMMVDGDASSSDESSEDEREIAKELRKQYREMQRKRPSSPSVEREPEETKAVVKEIDDPSKSQARQKRKATLGELLEKRDEDEVVANHALGSKEITFKLKSRRNNLREVEKKQHLEERKRLRRPVGPMRGRRILR
ncbi:unnamed protein product [Notodromas monacha]|uniref:Nucleolar protein 10 n=1 Tax=Notodromas monacha TaxID=399045 RepID=A0A7R9BLN1_9CRUS|nr:unnamed protein product [Notodromas monacha]CAG0917772.1 unnamed protein product [Notodromas monacha]